MASRRQFLQGTLAGTALVSLSGAAPRFWLSAAEATGGRIGERILIVVQLTGGNDGLNTVIPYADDEYYGNRFTLAIGRDRVLKVDDHVGLHPAMRAMSQLAERSQLAIVQGVGYPNPNRSHFESMDLWHTAHQVGGGFPTGWLGRCVDQNQLADQLPAIHFGPEKQPLALATAGTPCPSIESLESFQLDARRDAALGRQIDQLVKTPREGEAGSLLGFIHDNARIALVTSERLEAALAKGAEQGRYPQTGFGRKLQSIGRLIDADLSTRIYYVSLDGFDTHSNQAEAHQALLAELSDALGALMADLEQQGNADRVLVMCFSEFGRRVRENASRGTDHGTAAPMFLLGSRVEAGPVGRHPSLADLEDGDLKFHTDYRQVYAAVLEQWLGVASEPILGGRFQPVAALQM